MGIAECDPIHPVNLLYGIDLDRIHRIDRTHDVGAIDPDPSSLAPDPDGWRQPQTHGPERRLDGAPAPESGP